MKTHQVTVREGELLGPVDWDYDFGQHFRRGICSDEDRKRRILRSLTILQELELNPCKYEVTTYGGWPRCGWRSIISMGMYDGGPYWKPIPSVHTQSWTGGGEWHSFHNITDIRFKGEEWPLKLTPEREAVIKGIFDTHTSIRKAVDKQKQREYHKGEQCPYKPNVLCQEGYCDLCEIKEGRHNE